MKIMMISVMNGSHHMSTTKSTLSVMSQDEWDTKEGTGRMHCMYSGMTKGAEVTSNSEKIKPIALAIVELHKS